MHYIRIFAISLLLSIKVTHPIIDPVIAFMNANGCDRAKMFELVLRLIDTRQCKTIVETGTARGPKPFNGDGGFTPIFGYWCTLNSAKLYSVDIKPDAIKNALNLIKEFSNNVHLFLDDSVHFLENFDKTIDFLYLDSFDFDSNNPVPSQLHHLREIQTAYDKLAPNAVVMIDDCGLPHGGKGKFVVEYLQKKGWFICLRLSDHYATKHVAIQFYKFYKFRNS